MPPALYKTTCLLFSLFLGMLFICLVSLFSGACPEVYLPTHTHTHTHIHTHIHTHTPLMCMSGMHHGLPHSGHEHIGLDLGSLQHLHLPHLPHPHTHDPSQSAAAALQLQGQLQMHMPHIGTGPQNQVGRHATPQPGPTNQHAPQGRGGAVSAKQTAKLSPRCVFYVCL